MKKKVIKEIIQENYPELLDMDFHIETPHRNLAPSMKKYPHQSSLMEKFQAAGIKIRS